MKSNKKEHDVQNGIPFMLMNVANTEDVQYRSNVSWQSRLETRSSILKVFENQVSSFEARVSSFEYRVSSFESLVEFFENLEYAFRGNDLFIEYRAITMTIAIWRGLFLFMQVYMHVFRSLVQIVLAES